MKCLIENQKLTIKMINDFKEKYNKQINEVNKSIQDLDKRVRNMEKKFSK
jgi:prefoldin subunit 5